MWNWIHLPIGKEFVDCFMVHISSGHHSIAIFIYSWAEEKNIPLLSSN